MEMHQVRYFLAVAQELNFSRAAEKCNVTQPSLSRAIQQLEGELGGPLFHRERHLTHLTELGQMVRPHLETVYNAVKHVRDRHSFPIVGIHEASPDSTIPSDNESGRNRERPGTVTVKLWKVAAALHQFLQFRADPYRQVQG